MRLGRPAVLALSLSTILGACGPRRTAGEDGGDALPAWVLAPPAACSVGMCGRTYFREDAVRCAADLGKLNLALRRSAQVFSAQQSDDRGFCGFDLQRARDVRLRGVEVSAVWPAPGTPFAERTYALVCAGERTAPGDGALPSLTPRAVGASGPTLYPADAEQVAVEAARANLARLLESSVEGLALRVRERGVVRRLDALDVRAADWARRAAERARVVRTWQEPGAAAGRGLTLAEVELGLGGERR